MEADGPVPRVGVGVLVLDKSQSSVIVGRRRSSLGDSKFALPGGHLEFGETWEECAAREVLEETGLVIHNVRFAGVTNTIMLKERRPWHYVTIFMQGELLDPTQEPQNLEPDKCHGWEWVEWPSIPEPVFEPLQTLLKSSVYGQVVLGWLSHEEVTSSCQCQLILFSFNSLQF
ncbi:hypothetical protein L7F22_001248 [Adiantum nelumboides]|nr:hypothetical protein [Adiantum nelumboides]